MYFQSTKLTNILFWRDIHSFVSIRSQLNIRALICVYNRIGRTQLGNYLFSDSKVSGTIARKTDSLHVHVFGLRPVCAINFSRDQSSAKLINFLDSRLETRSSRLETRYSKLSRIEYRGSRLEGLSTYFWANKILALIGIICVHLWRRTKVSSLANRGNHAGLESICLVLHEPGEETRSNAVPFLLQLGSQIRCSWLNPLILEPKKETRQKSLIALNKNDKYFPTAVLLIMKYPSKASYVS